MSRSNHEVDAREWFALSDRRAARYRRGLDGSVPKQRHCTGSRPISVTVSLISDLLLIPRTATGKIQRRVVAQAYAPKAL